MIYSLFTIRQFGNYTYQDDRCNMEIYKQKNDYKGSHWLEQANFIHKKFWYWATNKKTLP